MSLVSLIDKPLELLELINNCLKPKDIEKKKFGEVFTPMEFINDKMLFDLENYYKSKYNKNIWEDEQITWFDPAAGMGNYPVAIFYKLFEGLKDKIPDDKLRKKHIIEKQLYMSELNKKNCFVIKQIFNINNDLKLNLYEGNSLELDINKEFGTNINICIGNPPYNEEFTKSGAVCLYNKFVDYYIDKCDFLTYVIPSRWFSGGKGLDTFRSNMLKRTDLVYINHYNNAKQVFGNTVDIEGGVNYFLKDKNYKGECLFNGSLTKLNKYDIFVESRYYSIIDKIIRFKSLTDIYIGRYFGIESNDKRLVDKINEENKDIIKCYVSQQKGFTKYINIKDIKKDYKFWKVITAEANGHKKCFGNIFIGNIYEIHTGSYISFKVETEEQAKSLTSYLKCKLPNFMLSLRKISQHINSDVCKWIPLVPLDQEWSDDKVYSYLKLSVEDITLINTELIGFTKDEIKSFN